MRWDRNTAAGRVRSSSTSGMGSSLGYARKPRVRGASTRSRRNRSTRCPTSSGIDLVLTAPDQRGFVALLTRLDREVFRTPLADTPASPPLAGRKLHLHVDWPENVAIAP